MKSLRQLIADIRDSVKNACPHDLTFKPTGKMTSKEIKQLQAQLDYHFDLWRRTWIYPALDELEKKLKKKPSVGGQS